MCFLYPQRALRSRKHVGRAPVFFINRALARDVLKKVMGGAAPSLMSSAGSGLAPRLTAKVARTTCLCLHLHTRTHSGTALFFGQSCLERTSPTCSRVCCRLRSLHSGPRPLVVAAWSRGHGRLRACSASFGPFAGLHQAARLFSSGLLRIRQAPVFSRLRQWHSGSG